MNERIGDDEAHKIVVLEIRDSFISSVVHILKMHPF